jgi:hypothetical protein
MGRHGPRGPGGTGSGAEWPEGGDFTLCNRLGEQTRLNVTKPAQELT